MTRDEMVHQFIYWFRLNPFTRYVDYPPADLPEWENRYFIDIDGMKQCWLQQAPAEWFPIALDIALNPPDLTPWNFDSSNPSWNAEEEFLIEIEVLLQNWYLYAPAIWCHNMTPLLNNEVLVSNNERYSASRNLALNIWAWGNYHKFLSDHEFNQLVNWIEPLTKTWSELNEEECHTLVGKLRDLCIQRPDSDARRILLNLRYIVGEPYQEWIEETLANEKSISEQEKFAQEWIEAWNAHDAERIANYCVAGVKYQSYFATPYENRPHGILDGRASVRFFAQRMFVTFPDLHFNLYGVYGGMRSIIVRYQSINNRTATDYLEFNTKGKIVRIVTHYSS